MRFFPFFVPFAMLQTMLENKPEGRSRKGNGKMKKWKDEKNKRSGEWYLCAGVFFLILFTGWTWLIQTVDVQPLGQKGTDIGCAAFNIWFHKLMGVHLSVYIITDWLGLVPIAVCLLFGGVGLFQWIKRRSLIKVDYDLLCLGVYYVLVVSGYLIFEMIPINYRPVLIDGFLEASYPSSTTLLVLSVMPTLMLQAKRRIKNASVVRVIYGFSVSFSAVMVIGRLISGVHWFTDIVGAVLLSTGLFLLYKAVLVLKDQREN